MKKKFSLFFLAFAATFYAMAQQNPTELYNKKKYEAAINKLSGENEENLSGEQEQYLKTFALIKLCDPGAELQAEAFFKEYPASLYGQELAMAAGNMLFIQRKYPTALHYYNRIDKFGLFSRKERSDFLYRRAYCLFANRDYDKAKAAFFQSIQSGSAPIDAYYYYAHISYLQGDYETAMNYFDKVTGEKKYADAVAFYRLNIFYRQKKYADVISLANEIQGENSFSSMPDENKTAFYKISGESAFMLKNWELAEDYLSRYMQQTAKPTAEDYYQLGYSYYMQGKYDGAREQLNKIVQGDGEISQIAYYVLAETYLKEGKKLEAANAFRSCASMNHDKVMQQDAAYNAAKLSYETGDPYHSVVQSLQSFLKDFPQSVKRQEIQSLLADSYLSAKDYPAAVNALKNEKNLGTELKTYLQKAAFYYALQLYEAKKYSEAQNYLSLSLENCFDLAFCDRARFWQGELYAAENKTEAAKLSFREFEGSPYAKNTPEYKNIDYTLGCIAFGEGDYGEALNRLERYVNSGLSENRALEVKLLMADSFFAMSRYGQSLPLYGEVAESPYPRSDYALLQKSICYQLTGKSGEQTAALDKLIKQFPNSQYVPQAYYNKGLAFQLQGKDQEALDNFTQAARSSKTVELTAAAKVKSGLIYSALGKDKQALNLYREVVENYPNTASGPTALQNAKALYIEAGNANDYIAWAKKHNADSQDENYIDSIKYAAAERSFIRADYKASKEALGDYLSSAGQKSHQAQAYYYLGASELELGDTIAAEKAYRSLMELPFSDYTELSQVKLANLLIARKKNEELVEVLNELAANTQNPQNIKFAYSNLMIVADSQADFEAAEKHALKMREILSPEDGLYCDATVILFSAYAELEKYYAAQELTDKLMDCASGRNAARTLYYKAFIENRTNAFGQSNETIVKLTSDYSSYKEYSGAALVLMAQNFYALGDLYQADYILNSVIDNFKDPSVVARAKSALELIKLEKTPEEQKEIIAENSAETSAETPIENLQTNEN